MNDELTEQVRQSLQDLREVTDLLVAALREKTP